MAGDDDMGELFDESLEALLGSAGKSEKTKTLSFSDDDVQTDDDEDKKQMCFFCEQGEVLKSQI